MATRREEFLVVMRELSRAATDEEIIRTRNILHEEPILIREPEIVPWLKLNRERITSINLFGIPYVKQEAT
jgi:hypothetical protein